MKNIKIMIVCLLAVVMVMGSHVSAVQNDDKNCSDHPLFTRMPGYWIHHCKNVQFDSFAFTTGIDPATKKPQTTTIEGQLWTISYYPQNDLNPKPGELQIIRNFENAIKEKGGSVVYSEKTKSTMKIEKDGKEIWVQVTAEFTGKHGLTIVQKEAMKQDIVANAELFSKDIKTTGHAAIYGILFDTAKSTIKPESAEAIGQIAKMLTSDPGLKIHVVGHTDNVGSIESNLKLSKERADAVIKELVSQHGIDAPRLNGFGCGQFAPVASNDTEEGRAKNRRVELVKQ